MIFHVNGVAGATGITFELVQTIDGVQICARNELPLWENEPQHLMIALDKARALVRHMRQMDSIQSNIPENAAGEINFSEYPYIVCLDCCDMEVTLYDDRKVPLADGDGYIKFHARHLWDCYRALSATHDASADFLKTVGEQASMFAGVI